MKARTAITLLDLGVAVDGHRGSYSSILSSLFEVERKRYGLGALCSRRPVLVPMIEDSFARYVFTSLFRALCRRKTVGLLFRPGTALGGGCLKHRVKGLILRLLRRIPQVQTLTILPFTVEPRFAAIADGWIYDPQLWDISEADRETLIKAEGKLCAAIRQAATGRLVCCAIGRQDRSKGFEWFASCYVKNPDLRDKMLFAFGGRVSSGLTVNLACFAQAGGFSHNAFVTDAELLELYAAADLVWCAYDPDYDQASGILGRAAQLGIPVVIRRGSLIHRLCEIEGLAHIAIDPTTDWHQITAIPPGQHRELAAVRARRMGGESLKRLLRALGEET